MVAKNRPDLANDPRLIVVTDHYKGTFEWDFDLDAVQQYKPGCAWLEDCPFDPALAIARVNPDTPLEHTLVHADRALRQLARSVVAEGDTLHKAIGAPLTILDDLPGRVRQNIMASAEALHGLRTWAFCTLIQAMNR